MESTNKRVAVFTNSNYQINVSLLTISMLMAALYGYLHFYIPGEQIILTKLGSIWALATLVYCVETEDKMFRNLLIICIFAHSLGDGAIEIFDNILICIPFFLVGHVLYGVIFLRDILLEGWPKQHSLNGFNIRLWQYLVIALYVMGAVLIASILLPTLSGVLFFGVVIYILVLLFAAILSIMHPACLKWVALGVILYVLSDTLIAYNEFVAPIVIRQYISWPLYYFAQLAIAYGLLNYHLNIKRR